MNAPLAIESAPLDDIIQLAPACEPGGAMYEARSRLRSHRNCASALLAKTPSATARQLAWLAAETATHWVYAGASEKTLREVGRFTHRIMLCAMQAEAMFDDGIGA